ncbi:MAG: EamA family transporter [Actinomycetota bacterium]
MFFGLLAALGWGVSDLSAAIASRRMGSRPVTVIAQLTGVAGFLLLFAVLSPPWDLPAGGTLVLFGTGLCAGVAYFGLYRGLELGPIALVSPIASAFGVVTVLLAVTVLGESLGGLEIAGIVATLVGVVLTSTDIRRLGVAEAGSRRGIPYAVAAMIGFGVGAFATGGYAQDYGVFPPTIVSRIGSLVLIAVVLTVRRRATPVVEHGVVDEMLASEAPGRDRSRAERILAPSGTTRRNVVLAIAVGIADVFGIWAYARGSELGLVSITAAVSATFTLIPVLGGVTLFRERPAPNQYAGIGLVVVGLILLGIGGA